MFDTVPFFQVFFGFFFSSLKLCMIFFRFVFQYFYELQRGIFLSFVSSLMSKAIDYKWCRLPHSATVSVNGYLATVTSLLLYGGMNCGS